MPDYEKILKAEIYTERLNDMYAQISNCLDTMPDNHFRHILLKRQKEISLAHKQSRFYCDPMHFDEWETQLSESQIILKKIRSKNNIKEDI